MNKIEKMLHELVGARVELRAIAKLNARLVALLERSVLSEGESVSVSLEKTENQATGEQKTTDDLISEVDRLRAVVSDLHLEVKAILSASQSAFSRFFPEAPTAVSESEQYLEERPLCWPEAKPLTRLETPASESTVSSRPPGIGE